MAITDTWNLSFLTFSEIREAVTAELLTGLPDASCYSSFEVDFDPETLQRRTTTLMQGRNADAAIFHAWMLGITQAYIIKGATGQSEFVGKNGFTLEPRLEIEGFFDYSGADPWKKAEDEARKIQNFIFRNRTDIVTDIDFGEVDITGIDFEHFADGETLIVCQMVCDFKLDEVIQ